MAQQPVKYKVHILEGFDLPKKSSGQFEYYVKVNEGLAQFGPKTKVDTNGKWYETVTASVCTDDYITVQLKHHSKMKDDVLGEFKFTDQMQNILFWQGDVPLKMKSKPAGFLRLEVTNLKLKEQAEKNPIMGMPMMGMPGQMPMMGMPGQMPMMGMPGQMPMMGMPGQMPMMGMPGQMPMMPMACSGTSTPQTTNTTAHSRKSSTSSSSSS